MTARPDGLIGGIRSLFWRRVALIFLGVPRLVWGFAPIVICTLPRALADAWDAFADYYKTPAYLFTAGLKAGWSKDEKPSA